MCTRAVEWCKSIISLFYVHCSIAVTTCSYGRCVCVLACVRVCAFGGGGGRELRAGVQAFCTCTSQSGTRLVYQAGPVQ